MKNIPKLKPIISKELRELIPQVKGTLPVRTGKPPKLADWKDIGEAK